MYVHALSVRENHETKLIFAPLFTVGNARVIQYGSILQISQKSVSRDTIHSVIHHNLI